MGRDAAPVAGDESPDSGDRIYGMGHGKGQEVGGGEGRWGSGFVDGARRESIPELEMGSERFGSTGYQLRELGDLGVQREEVSDHTIRRFS